MSRLKQIVFVLLLGAFGINANAQNLSRVPVEGSIYSYTCNGVSENSSYVFNVVANNGGQPGDFNFIGSNSGMIGNDGVATTQIQWNTGSSLSTYKVWLEVEINGCSNRIFIGVSPQPNNRSIGFDVVASAECFNLSDNSFAISFITTDNNGQPIPAAYFPLSVELNVNGESHTQTVSYNSQVLQVSEQWFVANPQQNTEVLVSIVNVTDVNNASVKAGIENGTHVRSIFAIPEIEFTEELRNKYKLKYETYTAYIDSDSRNMERMEPK